MRPYLTLVALALVVPSSPIGAQDAPHSFPSTAPPRSRPHVELAVASPIRPHELERYARMLHLSDAQLSWASDQYHEVYLARCRDVLSSNRIHDVWDVAAELAEVGDVTSNPVSADQFATLVDQCQRVTRQLAILDEQMFSMVAAILADTQLRSLDIVRLVRRCERARAVLIELPGAAVDLLVMVDLLWSSGLDTTASDVTAWEQFQYVYAGSLAALLERHAYRRCEAMVKGAQMTSAAMTATEPLRSTLEKRADLNRRYVRVLRRIVELNEASTAGLATLLPPSTAETLRDRVRQITYPTVFPNPHDASPAIDVAVEEIDLSEEQRLALLELRSSYGFRLADVEVELSSAYLDEREAFLVTKTLQGKECLDAKSELLQLRQDRRQLALEVIDQLGGVLSPKQFAQLGDVTELPPVIAAGASNWRGESAARRPKDLGQSQDPARK